MSASYQTLRRITGILLFTGLVTSQALTPSDALNAQSPPVPVGKQRSTKTAKPKAPPAKYVVYFYFAPQGCPHCRSMAPEMERFYKEIVATDTPAPSSGDGALDRR